MNQSFVSATINIDSIDIDVEFSFEPGCSGGRHHEDIPDEYDIHNATITDIVPLMELVMTTELEDVIVSELKKTRDVRRGPHELY